jgi:BolA protein
MTASGQTPADAVPSGFAIPVGPLPREARVEAIRRCLEAAFAPELLEVIDDSHKHAGHAGARDGRGHFTVRIVSPAFAGLSPLARHRAVYAALGDLMDTDIHALSIQATPPP